MIKIIKKDGALSKQPGIHNSVLRGKFFPFRLKEILQNDKMIISLSLKPKSY